ncbi:response regulator [Leclercia sp. 119287]|uniref:tetrathionate respiration response regulator TtrR n=1 Tax=Leclercia sp. 119287 TaxID=2681308 RepID=UPI0012E14BAC|nr:tetrathionate respiration response regulator TtrR [Leclercia sp. 119287]QGU14684.1 response regulator [Leclercia sp. 119287]
MIHLVDDDEAVTSACCYLLESLGHSVRCWNRSELFLREAPLGTTGVALLDMRMPEMDGHALFQAMREANSTLAVIFLTGHGDVPMAVQEIQSGAVDFLQKPVAAGALTAAIEKGYAHSARLTQTNELRLRYATLTPKEKEVAHWVAAGLMNKDIALKMHIALRTVEVHRARVMEKMDAKSMAELVLQINRSGA